MISIENFTHLADLEEELQEHQQRLEILKKDKEAIINEKANSLIGRIKRYLEHKGLSAIEVKDEDKVELRSKYKSSVIRGEVYKDSNEIAVFLNGERIRNYIVVPAPGKYHVPRKLLSKEDILIKDINTKHDEIENVLAIIDSLEREHFVYALVYETGKKEVIGDQDEVINDLFM